MELASAHRILCISLIMLFVNMCLVGAVSLKLSTTTLASSGSTVTIFWNGLESPTEFDWLGIYTPPESSDNHYIGYVNVTKHTVSGKGSYEFPAGNSTQL